MSGARTMTPLSKPAPAAMAASRAGSCPARAASTPRRGCRQDSRRRRARRPGPVMSMPVIAIARCRTGPRRRRVDRESRAMPGLSVSPHSLSRGKRARSTAGRARRPARARAPRCCPAGPAPTTSTSVASHGRQSRLSRPSEHQRAVLRSESEAVAQRGSMSRGAALLGMKSMSQSGSGSSRLIVGGRTPSRMRQRRRHDAGRAARALRMADHRFGRRPGHASACAPNTRRTHRDSIASFSCVDVP